MGCPVTGNIRDDPECKIQRFTCLDNDRFSKTTEPELLPTPESFIGHLNRFPFNFSRRKVNRLDKRVTHFVFCVFWY